MGRNFDSALAEQKGEPITFTLGEREWACPTPIMAAPLLEVASYAGASSPEAIKAFSDYIYSIIEPTQLDDFKRALTDLRVGFDLLNEIISYVTEEATSRPLGKPSDSSDSSSKDLKVLRDDSETKAS